MKKKLLIGIFIIGILINVGILIDLTTSGPCSFSAFDGAHGGAVCQFIMPMRFMSSLTGMPSIGMSQVPIISTISILFFLWAIFMTVRSINKPNVLSNIDVINRKSINRKTFAFFILLPFLISVTISTVISILPIGLEGARFMYRIYYNLFLASPIVSSGIGIIWIIVSYYFMRARCADFNNDARWIRWVILFSIISIIIVLLYNNGIILNTNTSKTVWAIRKMFIVGVSGTAQTLLFYTIVTLIFYPGIPKKTEEARIEESTNFHTNPIEKV